MPAGFVSHFTPFTKTESILSLAIISKSQIVSLVSFLNTVDDLLLLNVLPGVEPLNLI
jgi:hypothetical protein